MYTIYLTNFGYTLDGSFKTLDEAKAKARSTSFECVIRENGKSVMAYSYFGGFRPMR
jgi:hypothetical protein